MTSRIVDLCLRLFTNSRDLEDHDVRSVIFLCKSIPPLQHSIADRFDQLYVNSRPQLLPEFQDLAGLDRPTGTNGGLTHLLKFIYHALLEETVYFDISKSLCILHAHVDLNIANLASKCLGILIDKQTLDQLPSFDLGWRYISLLLKRDKNYQNIGYKMWLRWISRADISQDKPIQNQFSQNSYWSYIQNGIIGSSHDFKRYTIHILSKSIQLIEGKLSIQQMVFDSEENKRTSRYFTEWKRYISLIEIVSLDTSLNQTQDSLQDIHAVMKKDSLIPKSWALILLTAGLTSSMENIKKLILNFLLDISDDGLEMLTTSRANDRNETTRIANFLSSILLPTAILASNFYTISDSANGCPFGDKLSLFIQRLFSLQNEIADVESLANGILQFLYDYRYSFDPARIYVLQGLYNGLVARKDQSILKDKAMSLVSQLTNHRPETQLRQNLLSFYYIKLLVLYDSNGDFNTWYNALEDLYAYNQLLVLQELPTVVDYIRTKALQCFSSIATPKKIALYVELFYSVFGKVPTGGVTDLSDQYMIIQSDSTGCNALKQTEDFKESVRRSLNENCSIRNLAIAYPLLGTSVNDMILRKSTELKDIQQKNFDDLFSKLLLISVIGQSEQYLSVQMLLEILQGSFTGVVKPEERRYRDLCLAQCYSLLSEFQIQPNEFNALVNMISDHFTSAGTTARMGICKFLVEFAREESNYDCILSNNRELVESLSAMWFILVDERLVARERELHVVLLRAIFEVLPYLQISSYSESLLEKVAISVVDSSFSRRSLLPVLADLLSLCKQTWVARVLIYLYNFRQIDDHSFRLEVILAAIFDSARESVSSYKEFYGKEEVSARIKAIEYFQDVGEEQAMELFDFIVNSDYHVLQPVRRNDGAEEITRMRCFQILILLESKITDREYLYTFLREKLMNITISIEPSLSVRIYLEWLIARIYTGDLSDRKNGLKMILKELDQLYEPRIMISLLRIGLLVGRRIKTSDSQDDVRSYYVEYLNRALAFSTVNQSGVRHTAVSMVMAIAAELQKGQMQELSIYAPLLHRIVNRAESSEGFTQFISGEEMLWDIDDLSLLALCNSVMRQVSGKSTDVIGESAILKYSSDSTAAWDRGKDKAHLEVHEIALPKTVKTAKGPSNQIQVKSGAWNSAIDYLEDTNRSLSKIKRGELILLASLVDKPPNLGGICRLSDVLGVGLLCLNDLKVVNHPQFKNVAVTAEQWMPMEEVKIEKIVSYLLEKKREGYTLIGLEQTDNSVQLSPHLEFPKKSVLLLGKEREGIPGELLAELDFCIEIKQVGVIRSMNIQTAAAIVVQAYSAQHC